MKRTWDRLLMESLSDFNCTKPGALERIRKEIPDTETLSKLDGDSELSKLYWEAAAALVEPGYDYENEDEMKEIETYHDKSEEQGFDFVNGFIDAMEDSQGWKHMINLVNDYGY